MSQKLKSHNVEVLLHRTLSLTLCYVVRDLVIGKSCLSVYLYYCVNC